MRKQNYTKDIKASAEKVYKTMLGLDSIKTYQQWTAEFNPTSSYEGKWKKGEEVLFVGTDENGKRGGMISKIADLKPNQFVSIRHYGILDGDKKITTGPNVEKWAGGLENYLFNEQNGITTVTIEIDITEDFIEYFDTTWPKALNKLKEICENN